VSFSAPELEAFLQFTNRLELAGIEYMVTGSVAAMVYGRPRFTTDIDLIVAMDLNGALRLAQKFSPDEFYFPPIEVLSTESARETRGHFNILHFDSGFKADVYLRGNDPFRMWALQRVKNVQIGDASVRVAPPEYVIIRKLEFFREGGSEKHLRDVRVMMEQSPELIEQIELDRLVAERGLADELARARTVPL
jgi:hypothetical protein